MDSYWKIMLICSIVILFFGGIGYLIYIKTRPKKMKWTAYVYQLGAGVREESVKDRDGKILRNLKLKDLRAYYKDVLVREELAHGVTSFTLKRLGMPTNPVTADMVEVWGKEKIVRVLIIEDTANVMKSGYDKEYGEQIFEPDRRDKTEAMSSKMKLQSERYVKEKDILTAISPWIIALIVCGTVLGCVYVGGEAFVKISDNILLGQQTTASSLESIAKMMDESIKKNILLIQEGERERVLAELEKIPIESIE